jgi:hypothetical protein
MFEAEHVSLGPGQSYQNCTVLQDADYEAYGIPKLFGDLTFAFFSQNRCMILNQWNLRVVRLSKQPQGSGRPFQRLVLDRDITYRDGAIIPIEQYADLGIPLIIADELVQMAWTCPDGLMFSHQANVVSLILPDPRGGETEHTVLRTGYKAGPPKSPRSTATSKLTPQS